MNQYHKFYPSIIERELIFINKFYNNNNINNIDSSNNNNNCNNKKN